MIKSIMIAPCGINCATCIGNIREKRKCAGCNVESAGKPSHCYVCAIKNCEELKKVNGKYCFCCSKFPCTRLKKLDKRYRLRYNTSLIENLEKLKSDDIRKYMKQENEKWKCPACGSILSVHRKECVKCAYVRVI